MEAGQESTAGDARRGPEIEPNAPERYGGFDGMPLGEMWRRGGSNQVTTDRDPYDDAVLAEITLADTNDLEEAYRTAERNQRAWSRVKPQERRALMLRAIAQFAAVDPSEPEYPLALFDRAWLLAEVGRHVEAKTFADRYVALEPAGPWTDRLRAAVPAR